MVVTAACRARRARSRPGCEEELPRRDPAYHGRMGARQGARLRVAGLRLRLRVRAGPAVRAGRHRHDRQRPALALASGAGDGNLESDFFYQWIRDRGIVERLARRRAPHGPSKIVRATSRASSRATTATCARPGATSCPTRRAAARAGCARSPRSTCTGASTSSACARARATSSRRSSPPPRRRPARARRPPRRRTRRRSAAASDPVNAGLQRLRDRQQRRPRRALARARQPALPVAGLRALVRGAPHDPRQAERDRRRAAGRAGRQHRLQPRRRVEPHGLDRAAVHAVRARAARRAPDRTTWSTAARWRCASTPCGCACAAAASGATPSTDALGAGVLVLARPA